MRKLTWKYTLVFAAITGVAVILINLATLFAREHGLYFFIVTGIYLLSILLFYFWTDYHTRLISKLKEMAHSFAKGNFIPTIFITTDDELGQLCDTMHMMGSTLNSNIKETLKEKDRMETILASMVEGVLAFDQVGRLMLINKAAEEMLGVTWEEAKERYFLEILRNHQLADLLKKGLADGTRQVIEIKLTPGDTEYYRVYITPIQGKRERLQGAVMVLRNVTKLRQLEQMRSEFVANVSHELRTPLTSIKGYVETLLDGAMEDKELSQKFLKIMEAETDRLNRLITDLLFLSRLETGRVEVAKKSIESRQLLDKVVNVLIPVAQRKDITIKTYIYPQANTIYGNQDMLEQVLINLLDNAIKYSHDKGFVLVEVSPHEQGTAIKVTDQGIGIPAESLPRLFERFYRVDKARSRQVGGTGLGLSIVKHIVERHRGQVQVESEEGKGTTFTVILPNS
jgi:two-component system phosphate regulon sensor histidine kinase PhoR